MAKDKTPKRNPPAGVGFDPVRWVERLQDVNDASQFTAEEKGLISSALASLLETLIRHQDLPERWDRGHT